MMRAVVDTNIVIRPLIKPHGTVGPILSHLRNGYQTGVSLVLVRRYAHSQHGRVTFHVEPTGDGRWGVFTIQLETRPAQR